MTATYPVAVPEPDQKVDAPVDRSSLSDVVKVVVAMVGWLVSLVSGAIAAAIVLATTGVGADGYDDLSLGWIAVAQLGVWLGLLGTPWILARATGNGMRREFGLRARWSDLLVGGGWGMLGQFAIIWIVYLPMQWLTDVTQEEIAEPARNMADRASDPVGVVLLALIVGIGAPIVEEIFYRGLLQGSLVRLLGARWGIALASLAFGLVHFQLLQLPALTLIGAVFGILAHRFGRLGPAIAAHMVFNMTAVISLLVTS